MDLSVEYLGLKLRHPFMPGASPLADELDSVRALEDSGASAIVMRSLFEEQMVQEQLAAHHSTEVSKDFFQEAQSFFPDPEGFRIGPDRYLEHVRRIKQAVSVPVIASLNGTTASGWLEHARLIEQAGADALELNVYSVAADPRVPGSDIEKVTLEMVREVKAKARIPIAVKLSPFYTSMSHMAARLAEAGADGLVLFNRLFEPEIDTEALEVRRRLQLSDNSELPLRLRWLAILSPKLSIPLAVTGGVHDAQDAVRATMAGARVIQMVSALLKKGPMELARVRQDFMRWMEEHEYASLAQMRGSMSLASSPDPSAYERANYVALLQSWRAL
jgi:dihydroorotate dehydrogenase (fumarate)